MTIKEKWELLKSLLRLEESKKRKITIIVIAVLLLYITLAFLVIWFLFPVQKFAESKKGKISLAILSFILAFVVSGLLTDKDGFIALFKMPEKYTVYSATAQKVCKGNTDICTEFLLLDPMTVAETSKDVYTVYDDKNNEIGEVKKDAFVLKDSDKYNELAELKAKLEKELADYKAKQLAELEKNINKAFYKVELKQYSADGNGTYNFYVNPIVWNSLPYDQKENAFKNCVTYVSLKQKGTKPTYFKVGTKIKSSANAEVLAEYTILKGIQIK